MSNNTIIIITDSYGAPLGNSKENLDLLKKLGYKINEKGQVLIDGIAFSFRRTETHTQVVAHSHCKKPKQPKIRDETYYFIYNYNIPDVDVLTVLKEFVLKSEEEIKNHGMEISDEKESFLLFKSLKNVINNRIRNNETKLLEVACKCYDDKKPIQLKAGGIEKSVYFLVELCSKYKELNYIIYKIDDPQSEDTEAIRVYINQNTIDVISPAKQFDKYYKYYIKREKQREADLLRKAQGEKHKPLAKPELRVSAKKKGSSQIKFLSITLILLVMGYWAFAPSATESPQPFQENITNSIGMDFVLIPAGEFDMGSPLSDSKGNNYERPVHHVKISNAFYMGKYEVTQKQWRDIMGSSPSYFKGDDLPVQSVSWNDAQNFINKLNEKEDGNKYRLPTEAEWEYAARAGTNTRYSFGDDESKLGDYAWYYENSDNTTHKVGQKKPNPWGLYDMHGNVWEWVQDKGHDNYSGAPTDGSSWEGGDGSPIIRGGGWLSSPLFFSSASRSFTTPGFSDANFGFRLVMDVSASTNAPETLKSIPLATPKATQTISIPVITPAPNQKSFTNSIGMDFVLIPAGESGLSSDGGPVHYVKIGKAFYLGKYEVTQKQWRDVMGNDPSSFKGDNQPVDVVSWNDVQDFIKKLNEKEDVNKYRLPSESEWEYAARAGTTTRYSFGDNETMLGDYAWYAGNSLDKTHPVGEKKPNPWGLYDMYGNVWEWVQDKDYNYDFAPTDGSSWEGGDWSNRVRRGSGTDGGDPFCLSTFRCSNDPDSHGNIGFRLVMDAPASTNAPETLKSTSLATPKATQTISMPVITPAPDQQSFTNFIGMEYVLISAGEFDMGSPSNEAGRMYWEGPVHHVKISHSFYIGKYEVTQKQWHDVTESSPSYFKGDNLPVEQVSWNDVQDFIKKLNEKEGGNKYRLPTEAEWEYSARAGTTTKYSFGDDDTMLGDYAWYDANSGIETQQVGQKKPNPWGLYDMHGNVWEWVQDKKHNTYNGAPTDGSSWEIDGGSSRVARGGGYGDVTEYKRSAYRNDYDPGNRFRYLGFRLVRIS